MRPCPLGVSWFARDRCPYNGPPQLPEVHLFLKSLDIAGFKSFAQHTRFEFAPGITALVGPNGSGKSNVVDAVRWALGEQSIRDLRGQRAQDVIYAGPRKACGVAEVAVTFENGAGDADLPWPEACVARRLYRSGESDYLVNRCKARLRDVTTTLHQIGIDAARHVIVTQGMADALLSASPLERRSLLEQAAEVSTYRAQRDEAEHKLATVAQNVETVEVILAELEPRLRLLRRQARAVHEREEATEKLRIRLRDWYGSRWQDLNKRSDTLEAEQQSAARERMTVAERLARLEEQAEMALDLERSWHQQLDAARAGLNMAERERDFAARDLEVLVDRRSQSERSTKQRVERVARLGAAAEEGDRRLTVLRAEGAHLRSQRLEAEALRLGVQAEVERLARHLEEMNRGSAQQQEERDRADEGLRQAAQELAKLRGSVLDGLGRREDSRRWLDRCDASLESIDRGVAELMAELDSATACEDRIRSRVRLAEDELGQMVGRVDRLERIRSKMRRSLADASSTLTPAAGAVANLEEQLSGGLIQSLQIDPDWDEAIASALGSWSYAGTDGASLHAMDVAGFFLWRNSLNEHVRRYGRWADECADGLPEGKANPLTATVLVENDGAARALWDTISGRSALTIGSPPVQVVTRAGRRWSAVGVREGRPEDPAARYLRAKRRVLALERQILHHEQRIEAASKAREVARHAVCAQEEVVRAARDEARIAASERAAASASLERAESTRQALVSERIGRQKALTELEARLETLEGELEVMEAAHRKAQRVAHRAAVASKDADAAVSVAQAELHAVAEQAAALGRELEVMRARESGHAEVLRTVERDLQRASEEWSTQVEQQEKIQRESDALEAQEAALRCRLGELSRVCEEQCARMEEIRKQRPGSAQRADALREARSHLSSAVSRHERALAAVAQLQSERAALSAEVLGELGVQPSDLPPEVADPPGEDELRKLRNRALQYADADESVVMEWKDLSERQQYLQKHVCDLRSAAENLREIMQRADREMRQRYQWAFGAVNEEFGRVFRLMFQGGEARLEEIDDEGAVEIRARLPGRRSHSSAAFSGGERSLVATSLLFGVLRIRPTPFCVLDEVDAALDESNVDRYLRVLRELSRQTQMIVVTHNRATMAAADVLYGLTMGDDGVSNLLSLCLDDYDRAV